MWILTRSDWPMLVNLAVCATVSYQQVAKFETRIRVVATGWEAEHLLADCDTADDARNLVRYLAHATRQGISFVDLNRLTPAELAKPDDEAAARVR